MLWVLLSAVLAQPHLWTLGRTKYAKRGTSWKHAGGVFRSYFHQDTQQNFLKMPKTPCEFQLPKSFGGTQEKVHLLLRGSWDRGSGTHQSLVSRPICVHRGYRDPCVQHPHVFALVIWVLEPFLAPQPEVSGVGQRHPLPPRQWAVYISMRCDPGRGFLCLLLLSLDCVSPLGALGVLWEHTTQLMCTSSKSAGSTEVWGAKTAEPQLCGKSNHEADSTAFQRLTVQLPPAQFCIGHSEHPALLGRKCVTSRYCPVQRNLIKLVRVPLLRAQRWGRNACSILRYSGRNKCLSAVVQATFGLQALLKYCSGCQAGIV